MRCCNTPRQTLARSGFTLPELIGVTLIILAAVVLILPALQASRGCYSPRIQCMNNTKQIGLAMHTYMDVHRRLPGYWAPPPALAVQAPPRTWVASILPELEQQTLYDRIWGPDADGALQVKEVPQIPTLVCASDVDKWRSPAACSYVVNCGRPDGAAPRTFVDAASAKAPPDWRGNGLFAVEFPAGMISANPLLDQSSFITTVADGASNTILASENMQSGEWLQFDGVDEPSWPTTVERAVGIVWFPEVKPRSRKRPPVRSRQINVGAGLKLSDEDRRLNLDYARPSSPHQGGVIVAFADASVRFVSERIDYRVYCQLMTSDSSRLGEPGGAAGPPPGAGWAALPVPADEHP